MASAVLFSASLVDTEKYTISTHSTPSALSPVSSSTGYSSSTSSCPQLSSADTLSSSDFLTSENESPPQSPTASDVETNFKFPASPRVRDVEIVDSLTLPASSPLATPRPHFLAQRGASCYLSHRPERPQPEAEDTGYETEAEGRNKIKTRSVTAPRNRSFIRRRGEIAPITTVLEPQPRPHSKPHSKLDIGGEGNAIRHVSAPVANCELSAEGEARPNRPMLIDLADLPQYDIKSQLKKAQACASGSIGLGIEGAGLSPLRTPRVTVISNAEHRHTSLPVPAPSKTVSSNPNEPTISPVATLSSSLRSTSRKYSAPVIPFALPNMMDEAIYKMAWAAQPANYRLGSPSESTPKASTTQKNSPVTKSPALPFGRVMPISVRALGPLPRSKPKVPIGLGLGLPSEHPLRTPRARAVSRLQSSSTISLPYPNDLDYTSPLPFPNPRLRPVIPLDTPSPICALPSPLLHRSSVNPSTNPPNKRTCSSPMSLPVSAVLPGTMIPVDPRPSHAGIRRRSPSLPLTPHVHVSTPWASPPDWSDVALQSHGIVGGHNPYFGNAMHTGGC